MVASSCRIALGRLTELCRRWGGEIVVLDSLSEFDERFDGRIASEAGYYDAPFSDFHGVHWEDKRIYTVKSFESTSALIHEMGHVFASPRSPAFDPEADDKFEEYDFFGWEIAVARIVGCLPSWSRDNKDYQVSVQGSPHPHDELQRAGNPGLAGWGCLSRWYRKKVIRERLAHAQSIGLVTPALHPVSIR